MGVRVRVGGETRGHHRPHDPAPALQRDQESRPNPLFIHLPMKRVGVGEVRVGREVVDQQGLAREDEPEHPLVHDVACLGRVAGDIVLVVKDQLGRGVLGEYRERPPALVQMVDDEPIVRNDSADTLGEFPEEPSRVELLLHGAPDRRQRGEHGRFGKCTAHSTSHKKHNPSPLDPAKGLEPGHVPIGRLGRVRPHGRLPAIRVIYLPK